MHKNKKRKITESLLDTFLIAGNLSIELRKKGLKREFNSWDSYLPTLVMFFQIIYSIGFKKNINPFKTIYSFICIRYQSGD